MISKNDILMYWISLQLIIQWLSGEGVKQINLFAQAFWKAINSKYTFVVNV